MTWFVYIIKSEKDGSLYTGISKNPELRLKKHNSGYGAKRTKGRGPWVNVWTSTPMTKSFALKLEHRIKKMSKEDKIKKAEQLRAELAMLEADIENESVPKMLSDEVIDYTNLKKLAQDYILSIKDNMPIKDVELYMFEEVITLYFGNKVWQWINNKS